MGVSESWSRIAAWHDGWPGRRRLVMAAGATEAELTSLERTIGDRLPADVRESYLLHNGTSWLLDIGDVMSLSQVEAMWREYARWQRESGYGLPPKWEPEGLEGPIKPIWWSPSRIPVTDNGGGDPVMIDLDPAEGGTRGQVIEFSHEVGPQLVWARSWAEWLSGIADRLEAGGA